MRSLPIDPRSQILALLHRQARPGFGVLRGAQFQNAFIFHKKHGFMSVVEDN
jgi:hypothetical protein